MYFSPFHLYNRKYISYFTDELGEFDECVDRLGEQRAPQQRAPDAAARARLLAGELQLQ